jgi:hypothetical protein
MELSKKEHLNPLEEDWSEYSESHIVKNILGLDMIWDCGQDSWLWQN